MKKKKKKLLKAKIKRLFEYKRISNEGINSLMRKVDALTERLDKIDADQLPEEKPRELKGSRYLWR